MRSPMRGRGRNPGNLSPHITGRAGTMATGCLAGCLLLLALAPGAQAQYAPPTGGVALPPPSPVGLPAQLVQVDQPKDPKDPKDPKVPDKPPPALPGPTPLPGSGMPFGPDKVRMPRLPGGLGTTPVPTQKDIEEYGRFVDRFVDPRNTLDLVVNRTRILLLKEKPNQTQIADERVASLNVLNPKQVILIGKQVGTTVLTLFFTDPKDNSEKILSYLVRVIPDPEDRLRLERSYQALAEEINEAFPDSVIEIRLVGDKLVVCGQAKDIVDATQILRIVRANAPEETAAKPAVDNVSVVVQPGPDGTVSPSLRDFFTAGGPNVINLIRVPGEQQVMLRVTVAEINRSAARSIGMNFNITNNQGVTVFANRTGNIATGGTASLQGGGGLAGALLSNNLPVALDGGQINLAINALRTLNYARTLSEPNLVAMNGQTASFQAGGQFPVPVTSGGFGGQNNGFGGLQGVQFVPYGVQLNFTPVITEKDRIRLVVAANVSTRDLQASANIGGANVPGLNTRNFNTTVELREGETLAVAGLIQNNIGTQAQRVPFIGDLPVLSRLTGFDTISTGEQELVILVTPELVHPMEPKEIPPLPGSDLFEPSDLEFYVLGRLESHHAVDYRSPVRTDCEKMKAYRRCEDLYLFGPSGHSDCPEHH